MAQRFPMNAGGGAVLPLAVGGVALPAIGLYLRFVQHESWGIVGAALGVLAVICIWAAVWGSRMNGKAIELTDEGIAFPRVWSREPETIVWTGIEGCESGLNPTTGSGAEHWFEIIYYGGRRRRIMDGNVLDFEGLKSAVCAALERGKASR